MSIEQVRGQVGGISWESRPAHQTLARRGTHHMFSSAQVAPVVQLPPETNSSDYRRGIYPNGYTYASEFWRSKSEIRALNPEVLPASNSELYVCLEFL